MKRLVKVADEMDKPSQFDSAVSLRECFVLEGSLEKIHSLDDVFFAIFRKPFYFDRNAVFDFPIKLGLMPSRTMIFLTLQSVGHSY